MTDKQIKRAKKLTQFIRVETYAFFQALEEIQKMRERCAESRADVTGFETASLLSVGITEEEIANLGSGNNALYSLFKSKIREKMNNHTTNEDEDA